VEIVIESLVEDGLERETLHISVHRLEAGGREPDALDAESGSDANPVLCMKGWSDDEAEKEYG
jgi:hypothetical protein